MGVKNVTDEPTNEQGVSRSRIGKFANFPEIMQKRWHEHGKIVFFTMSAVEPSRNCNSFFASATFLGNILVNRYLPQKVEISEIALTLPFDSGNCK